MLLDYRKRCVKEKVGYANTRIVLMKFQQTNTIPNFDAVFKQVTETLPKGLLSLHHDLEKNLRVALDSGLRKMNLVTREEFEVQSAVLERTRTRLEALEAKVAALEAAHLPKAEPVNSQQPETPNQAE
jgi:hypothetical protein